MTTIQRTAKVRERSRAPAHSNGIPLARSGDSVHTQKPRDVGLPLPQPNMSRGKRINVLVADNHPVVREGLAALINRRPDMRVIAEAGNGREALEQFFAQRPDIALLDLRMPLKDGVEALIAIRAQAPAARLVIVSTFQNEQDIYRAVQAGARGYVLKDASTEDLVQCIRTVASGGMWFPPAVAAKLAKRLATRQLTPRELEVLLDIARGKSNKEIGTALCISEATVKVHVTHILEKLKVAGRTEAIGVAVVQGLVDMGGIATA